MDAKLDNVLTEIAKEFDLESDIIDPIKKVYS